MPLKALVIQLKLNGIDDVVEVEAINPDYIRVEAEGPRLGLPTKAKAHPNTYMTMVAWAACRRLKLYDGSLQDFLYRDCLGTDFPKDDDEGAADVPPTNGAVGTDSPSPSPTSTATSSSG